MTKLLQSITNWLKVNPQSELEEYIVSKNPTNPAEVDFWTKQYEHNKQCSTQLWGRGL